MKIAVLERFPWYPSALSLQIGEPFIVEGIRAQGFLGPEGRQRIAKAIRGGLESFGPSLMLDQDGFGWLGDIHGSSPSLHATLGCRLLSHFTRPIEECFPGTSPDALWRILQEPGWVKAFADRFAAEELAALGVPDVIHLPAAAWDDFADPLVLQENDERQAATPVASWALPHGDFFEPGRSVLPVELHYGAMALATGRRRVRPSSAQDPIGLRPRGQGPEVFREYLTRRRFRSACLGLGDHARYIRFLRDRLSGQFALLNLGENGLPAPVPSMPVPFAAQVRRAAIHVGLNFGRSEEGADSLLLNTVAAGGFLLAHRATGIEVILPPGEGCDTFGSEEELLSKLERYLTDETLRKQVVRRGREIILSAHLFKHRLADLLQQIDEFQPCQNQNKVSSLSAGRLSNPPKRPIDEWSGPQGSLKKDAPHETAKAGVVSNLRIDRIRRSPHAAPSTAATGSKVGAAIRSASKEVEGSVKPATGSEYAEPIGPPARAEPTHDPSAPNWVKRLLLLQNPGRVSRFYLEGLARGAASLGISIELLELSTLWRRLSSEAQAVSQELKRLIERLSPDLVLGYTGNGVWDLPLAIEPSSSDGRVQGVLATTGIPHLLFWTDHPHWAHERKALHPELQPLLNQPTHFHWLKSESAAEEIRDRLGWKNVLGLAMGEDPQLVRPSAGGRPEFDVVAIVGSPPYLPAPLNRLIDRTAVTKEQILDAITSLAKEKAAHAMKGASWTGAPASLGRLASAWIDVKRSAPERPCHEIFREIAADFGGGLEWLDIHPIAYFDLLDAMWEFGRWQRTFILVRLARQFKVGVFGADWSSVGVISNPAWVDYERQNAVYGQGRIAINLSQCGDEAGASHKLFQIVASGIPCIHLDRPGIRDLFEPGDEIRLISDAKETADTLAELLRNPSRSAAMADRALARLEREHTWGHRLAAVIRRLQPSAAVVSHKTAAQLSLRDSRLALTTT